MFHEHHYRSLYKSITWMITAFVITTIVLYVMQGNLAVVAAEAIFIQAIKFVFFYFHERVWNKTNFGQSLRKGKKII